MTCRISVFKLVGLIALNLAMLALCAWCVTLPSIEGVLGGAAGLLFFTATLIVALARLFRRGPVLILDGNGVRDLRTSVGLIPWGDITSIQVVTVRGQRFLGLGLRNLEEHLGRSSRKERWLADANRWMGYPEFSIGFNDLTPGLNDVLSYLRQHHPEKLVHERKDHEQSRRHHRGERGNR